MGGGSQNLLFSEINEAGELQSRIVRETNRSVCLHVPKLIFLLLHIISRQDTSASTARLKYLSLFSRKGEKEEKKNNSFETFSLKILLLRMKAVLLRMQLSFALEY